MNTVDIDDDEFRWLEQLDTPQAMEWVRAQNRETTDALGAGAGLVALRDGIRQVLDAADRIPMPGWLGDLLYDFWQDATHPRGIWRRTSFEQYRRAEPVWEVLLDLDDLAAREAENWVWQGATVLRPGLDRALISLSRGGGDAVVVREFDLATGDFVADGFTLPEAKSDVCWIDRDQIYVGTDFGPGSLTGSGYPRVAKRWRRGTALSAAEVVFEGRHSDVSVYAVHDPTPGFERDLVGRRIDFFRTENHLLAPDGELVAVPVPDDAELDWHREWLLIQLRSDWSTGDARYPAGALLVTRLAQFVAGAGELTVLFTPDDRTALSYHQWTRGQLILVLLRDVRSLLVRCVPSDTGWRQEPLPGAAELTGAGLTQVEIVDTEPERADDILLSSAGFLQPTALHLARADGAIELLKREPAYFDPGRLTVRQFFATSADGTPVPYFVIGDAQAPPGPTLITGYGGFEISLTPCYNAIIGRGWLARGGSYVVANIRGGGEYGPRWHHAALRERRPRAYEDFAAVAEDLVRRGVTVPDRLGAYGGSNGGLLMGVMLTRYPQLFGAIVSHVPLLDMRRYHELLAGASWIAEYGDPDNPQDWAFLREYSPYHNIREGRAYPPVLFITSTRDDRVHPGHARKMVARLRAQGRDVAYHENVEGGHGAAANNEQAAFKWALTLDFLWSRLTADG